MRTLFHKRLHFCRHVGDFGNIEEDRNGNVLAMAQDRLASLTGRFPIVGRSIVVSNQSRFLQITQI